MKKFISEFKSFITKGNVLDLAVAVIIGGAFGKITTSLVNDIIMPPLGKILGNMPFKELKFVLEPKTNNVEEVAIRYGSFIQTVVDFLIIGFVVFIIVKIATKLSIKAEPEVKVSKASNEEILLTEIRDILKNK